MGIPTAILDAKLLIPMMSPGRSRIMSLAVPT